MNDLDDLKQSWKTISESRGNKEYSPQELLLIVKRKSNNELHRIRRKLLTEWSSAIILSVLLFFYIGYLNPNDAIFAGVFLLIILAISFVPYINLIRLNIAHYSDLRSHLKELIERYEKLVSEYTRLSFVMIPIGVLGGFAFGYHSNGSEFGWDDLFEWKKIILLIVVLVSVAFAGCYFQKKYFKWFYGKNMERIKKCIADLEEAENEINE
jgi:hypothetical protein